MFCGICNVDVFITDSVAVLYFIVGSVNDTKVVPTIYVMEK